MNCLRKIAIKKKQMHVNEHQNKKQEKQKKNSANTVFASREFKSVSFVSC